MSLDDIVTLVVGRNNSGKTSLTEILFKFLGEGKPTFIFEDFSIGSYDKFRAAYCAFKDCQVAIEQEDIDTATAKEQEYQNLLPKIELILHLEYEPDDNLAAISKFIMDLDENRTDISILCEYSIDSPKKLFEVLGRSREGELAEIIPFLRKEYRSFFKVRMFCVDICDPLNRREIHNKTEIENVFLPRFIYAQNQLDDQSTDKSKGLSKGFEDYFKYKNTDNAHIEDINTTLSTVSNDLDSKYPGLFAPVFEDLRHFGIGVDTQGITLKSNFEADKILKGNTQLFYSHGTEDDLLPEAHNGLGYSKLIYTILRFVSFYEELQTCVPQPQFQLIFVEEPEAHLHPQMQYVFIKNIVEFIKKKGGWKAQVVITTHSSHLVSESGFECIRYFDNLSTPLNVKNLSEFCTRVGTDSPTLNFLRQYMSLNRCDMFFADKVILIEGTVERLLLPEMIKRESPTLLQEYLSIIEVGGAYAHLFKELLEFLNVQTLIITDIDAVNPNTHRSVCPVSTQGAESSNATLTQWLPSKKRIEELISATDADKTGGKFRVAYQKSEDDGMPCGRSFEEAFIIKNAKVFSTKYGEIVSSKKLFEGKSESNIVSDSYDIASKIEKKTDFAFDIMSLKEWETPKYISEGLKWLTN